MLLLAIALCAGTHTHAAVRWNAAVEIASGGGERGPWRQNDSRYDYVDDATVLLDSRGAAAIAWVDHRAKDVFFQIYNRDGKARHAKAVNVSRSAQIFSWLPRLALSPRDDREIYVIWQEIVFSGGSHGGEIFFTRSSDGGESFGKPLNLSQSVPGDGKGRINRDVWHNGSFDLAVGVDGTIYAAWTEYDGPLWLSRSTYGGRSFSKPLRVAGGGKEKPARAPALAVASDKSLYLAWTTGEDESADIRIARSVDAGRTFGPPRVIAETKGYSDAPKLAVDRDGTLHVAYAESAGGPFDRHHVRYARSRDGARTFERWRDVSSPAPENAESSAFPALALNDRGDVIVTWELYPSAGTPPRGLGITVSRDGGQTFTPPAAVPSSSDPDGINGSREGLLMRKLAVRGGDVALANSSLQPGTRSRVWLVRGELTTRQP